MDLRARYPNTWKYQPFLDEGGAVTEDLDAYIARMKTGHLQNWPNECLKEWLHRHGGGFLETYSSLDFQSFRFTKEEWAVADIPGREVFRDIAFCDTALSIQSRATANPIDWLAQFMLAEGTWNTPIILLENLAGHVLSDSERLKMPYHLLEGHRRLSFLQELKLLNIAKPRHSIWMVRIPK